jgi:hypothetical protein
MIRCARSPDLMTKPAQRRHLAVAPPIAMTRIVTRSGAKRVARELDAVRIARLTRILCARAQRLSTLRGLPINLTPEYIERLFYKQESRCAVTGRKFSLDWLDGSRTKPWAPSVDRIKPARGYMRSNVRLVTWAVNRAMSDAGSEFLMIVARDMVRHDRQRRRSAT